jgi:hypothetical protein
MLAKDPEYKKLKEIPNLKPSSTGASPGTPTSSTVADAPGHTAIAGTLGVPRGPPRGTPNSLFSDRFFP